VVERTGSSELSFVSFAPLTTGEPTLAQRIALAPLRAVVHYRSMPMSELQGSKTPPADVTAMLRRLWLGVQAYHRELLIECLSLQLYLPVSDVSIDAVFFDPALFTQVAALGTNPYARREMAWSIYERRRLLMFLAAVRRVARAVHPEVERAYLLPFVVVM
jgi:hypothetical protein